MNRRFLLALVASALFGLVAILIFQKILQNKLIEERNIRPNQIVYATTKIPAGTTITLNQVKLVAHDAQLEGAISRTQDVVGKIAQVDLDASLPIRANLIASDKDNRRLTLKPGYRAVAIRVDEASSVAGFATPGSWVDVGAVIAASSNSKPVSKIIVQNLRVLANGQQTQVKTENTGRTSGTVTLEVSSAQAETLMLTQREGTLYLTLRHPADQNLDFIPPVDMGHVVEHYKNELRSVSPNPPPTVFMPTPKLTPTPTPTISPTSKIAAVRVIAGDKVETVQVRQ